MRARRWLILLAVVVAVAAAVRIRTRRSEPPPGAGEVPPALDARRAELLQLNNRGVAAMEQFRFGDAAALFREAAALDPGFVPASTNLGLALYYDRRTDEAAAALDRLVAQAPSNPTARFVLALIERERGRNGSALAHLAVVLQHDPKDAAALYLAGALESAEHRFDRAIARYRAAVEIEPRNVSALYGLARALVAGGDLSLGERAMERFQQVKRGGGSTAFGNLYLEQGRYARALPSPRTARAAGPQRPTFAEVAATSGLLFKHEGPATAIPMLAGPPSREAAAAYGSGAAFLDADGDGWLDLYLANASASGTARSVLYLNREGAYAESPPSGAEFEGSAMGVAAADFDNDGRPDLFVAGYGRSALFRNQGGGKFSDATARLPKGVLDARWCLSPAWADVDHDGDLDLAVVAIEPRSGAGSNLLLRNNRNGTFRETASSAGFRLPAADTALLLTDFNRSRDLDLLLVGSPWRLLSNARDGTFVEALAGLPERGGLGGAAADFDGDGEIDLCAPSDQGALLLWNRGGRFEAKPAPIDSRAALRNAHAFDFDNDGDEDVLLAGDVLRLLENGSERRFTDVSAAVGLDRIDGGGARAVTSADFDRDGDLDVLVTRCGRPPLLLRNNGGSRNRALRLGLEGKGDNRPGLGSSVELAAAGLYTRVEWTGRLGYMSQSATEVLLGLGPDASPDFVRVLWPTGVLQTETVKPDDLRLRLVELDRKGTSCPILYAWDGARYGFVTDLLGGSAVGYLVAPGRYAVPDTDEYVKIDGERLETRGGTASLRFVNQLEETIFFDAVGLLAVDHPGGVEVFPDERLLSAPPFPEFRVVAAASPRPVRSARDGRGRSWTAELCAIDRAYARGFDLLPFKGYARRHDLILDLGDLRAAHRVVLLLDGWVEYADSTSNFAAAQAGLVLQPPRLDAWDGSAWRTLAADMGFPAGLPRTMVVDLTGKLALLREARVRIRTNMCVYWDRIRVETGEAAPVRVRAAGIGAAGVAWVGYPRPWSPDGLAPFAYDFDRRDAASPWKRPSGRYSARGDVRDLVARVDDRYVVLPHGEALELELATAGLPPLEPGWRRDWLVYADGFGKDMDLHSAAGDAVDPLPRHRDLPYRRPEWRLAAEAEWEAFRRTLVPRSPSPPRLPAP